VWEAWGSVERTGTERFASGDREGKNARYGEGASVHSGSTGLDCAVVVGGRMATWAQPLKERGHLTGQSVSFYIVGWREGSTRG